MVHIRQLNDVLIVVGQLTAVPNFRNGRKNRSTILHKGQIRRGVSMCGVIGVAPHSTVALIPQIGAEGSSSDLGVPCTNCISGLSTYELPNICSHVPSSKGVEVPICLDSRQLAIMVVVTAVGSSNQVAWKRRSKNDASDMVCKSTSIAISLPRNVDESFLVEVSVLEKRLHETSDPGT